MRNSYRILTTLLIVCCIFFSLGCQTSDLTNPDQHEPGSLTGAVLTIGFEPLPLEGATVTINDQSYLTDAEGEFSTDKLPEGTYEAVASKTGYLSVPLSITIVNDKVTSQNFQLPLEPGSVITFSSEATNLVDEEPTYTMNVYVYNKLTDTLTRITLLEEEPVESAQLGVGARIETPYSDIVNPSVSADGRYVVFSAVEDNDELFSETGIFVYDMLVKDTKRITPTLNATSRKPLACYFLSPNYSISADGRYIVYTEVNEVTPDAELSKNVRSPLVLTGKAYRYDMQEDTTEEIPVPEELTEEWAPRYVTISGDGNHALIMYGSTAPKYLKYQIHTYDFSNASMKAVFVQGGGEIQKQDTPTISFTGRYIVYPVVQPLPDDDKSGQSFTIEQVYLKDMEAEEGTPDELISVGIDGEPGNDWSYYPTVSADGRYVAFTSYASNLVEDTPGTENSSYSFMFVRDRNPEAKKTFLVAKDLSEIMGGNSSLGYITQDGKYVVSNIFIDTLQQDVTAKAGAEAGDTKAYQIFLNDWMNDTYTLISRAIDDEDPDTSEYGNYDSLLEWTMGID